MGFLMVGVTPLRKYAFSQMARCPTGKTLGPLSPCNEVKKRYQVHGIHRKRCWWRYTVWLKFDGVRNEAVALEGCRH